MKMPFLEPYLEEYSVNDDDIKKLLEDNKCNLIRYEDIVKETNLNDCDYIIITDEDKIKKIKENDEFYNKYKKKLFYFGNYNKKYENILKEIKSGINICDNYKFKKIVSLSNLTKYVSFGLNINFDYLSSSLSLITHRNIVYHDVEMNNLPNKLKILHFNDSHNYCFEIQKVPKKSIILIKSEHFQSKKCLKNCRMECFFDKEIYKKELEKIKAKKIIIITNRINNDDYEDFDDDRTYEEMTFNVDKIVIIKDNDNIKLIHKKVLYNSIFNDITEDDYISGYDQCIKNKLKLFLKEKKFIKLSLKIIFEDFVEYCLSCLGFKIELTVNVEREIKDIKTNIEENDVDNFLDKTQNYVKKLIDIDDDL